MTIKIFCLSFHVFTCACPMVISSIFGKNFHFPFPYFVKILIHYVYSYVLFFINLFQAGGGYSSNGSDIIDSEEEEGMLDQSIVDDMERVDVEGEVESPVSVNKTSSPVIRTPISSNRNRCTNSSGYVAFTGDSGIFSWIFLFLSSPEYFSLFLKVG